MLAKRPPLSLFQVQTVGRRVGRRLAHACMLRPSRKCADGHLARRPRRRLRARRRDVEPARQARRDRRAPARRRAPTRSRSRSPGSRARSRQGRIGVGWATLRGAARRGRRPTPSLTLREVDAALAEVAATAGKGSAAARSADAARAVRARHRRRAGLPRPPARRRAAPGRARGRDARRDRRRRRPARGRRAPRGDAHRQPAARSRAWRCGDDGARRRSRASPSPCTGRCSRCSRRRPTTSPRAMAQLGTAALEWKVDGARVQVHKAGGEVKVYTRALKDVTASVPEIVEALQALPAQRADPRRRGDRARRRRRAAAVPGDDAPLRPQARRRARCAPSCRSRCTSSTACTSTAASLLDAPGAASASTRSPRRCRRRS